MAFMPRTVILGAARTPVGKMGGGLASLHPTDLGGIAIKDIASPRSFEVMEILDGMSDVDLPVPFFFNDMQGTCATVLAALRNALRITGKEIGSIRAAMTGAGGAGLSVARFLRKAGVKDLAAKLGKLSRGGKW